ncbi:MAG TPA: hypothetical protein VGG65_10370, partial [Thermoanaerobaculia bacterium]
MIRPVLAEGEAPAAKAAVGLVAGIFGGAWSVSGSGAGVLLLAASAAGLAVLTRLGRRRIAFRMAFAAFWLAAGFLSGRLRIAEPAERARAAFAALGAPERVGARLEGVVGDFWSGEPPRARATVASRRLRVG